MSDWIFTTPGPKADARIAYGTSPYQFAELRLPAKKSNASSLIPVMVVIHGGYWMAEYDYEYITHLCADLTERGIATWCIEYRRLGNEGGGWPGTFLDVAASVDFLPKIAAEYSLDLEKMSVIGHSAGGHLALWLAARHRIKKDSVLYHENPQRFRKVISLAGVNDLHECWEKKLYDNINVVEHFMAGSPAAQSERYAAGSPAALLPMGNQTKQLLIHGRADVDAPVSLSENYYATAKKLGDDVTLSLSGVGHFELVDPNSDIWQQIVPRILED